MDVQYALDDFELRMKSCPDYLHTQVTLSPVRSVLIQVFFKDKTYRKIADTWQFACDWLYSGDSTGESIRHAR